MKIYPEYKSSGIDWLGQIPRHWMISKYKYHSTSRMGETILRENLMQTGVPVYSATQDDSIFGYVSYPKLLLRKGDFVIPARGNSIGYVSTVSFDQATCSQTTICSIDFSNIKPQYLFYCTVAFKSEWFFYDNTAIPQITVKQVENNIVPLPPIEEQAAIAGYLDEVTTKIELLLVEKRAQVEDLRKYRTSLITETVTRGLNPNVPVKQTNSEWFPNIPTNWSIEKFKYQATVKANLVHPMNYTQYPQISPDSIEKNTGRLIGYESVEEAGIISDNHLFYKGQIIYSKIRPNLNKVIIAPFDGLCSADMYPIETLNNVKYFQYLMLSNPFVSQVSVVIQDRVKMPKINQVELGEILILVPPISEQQQIADYLDEKTAKIDALIEELEAQLNDLAIYKQAVITEAVTGKVDVRDWTPKS